VEWQQGIPLCDVKDEEDSNEKIKKKPTSHKKGMNGEDK